MRVVSLVPSLTETVVAYGRLEWLVARTRYCVEPAGRIEGVEAVGGTKNPDVERIIELAPDLVIVNKEENRVEDVRRLEAAGLRIHVTHPRTVAEAIDMLDELGHALDAPAPASTLTHACRAELAETESCPGGAVAVFCPIWRRPWMTVGAATYVGDVLRHSGFRNIFDDNMLGDFFEVALEEVSRRRPRVLLLPDEPFAFTQEHARELHAQGVPGQPFLVDGKDLAWYGPRLPGALRRLRGVAERAGHEGDSRRPHGRG